MMGHNFIVVEGNIGVGKSTFLNVFENEDSPIRTITEVIGEPIGRWQDIEGFNAFELFYKNPKENSFAFENIVFNTVVDAQLSLLPPGKQIKLSERSLWSAYHVFTQSLYKNLTINQFEYAALKTSYNLLCKRLVGWSPDQIIYLTCPPEILKRRIEKRGRTGEEVITLSYLEQLNRFYENWINEEVAGGTIVHQIDTNQSESGVRADFKQIIQTLEYGN